MICLALVSPGALFNLGNAVVIMALCYICSGFCHYVLFALATRWIIVLRLP